MFVAVQLPFVDLRQFVATETFRTKRPQFELAAPGDFVRSAGQVEVRRRGAPADWPAEHLFADAKRFVRFRERALMSTKVTSGMRTRFRSEYRRLYWDGRSVMRLELGMTRVVAAGERPLAPARVPALAGAALRLPVRVASCSRERPLGASGRAFAERLLRATSLIKAQYPDQLQPWWIEALPPLVFVEYQRDEVGSLPRFATRVEVSGSPDLTLHHLRLDQALYGARVWMVQRDSTNRVSDRRVLRLHLMRIHAERAAIQGILRAIKSQCLRLEPYATDVDELLAHIRDASSFLRRSKIYGHAQSKLLKSAYGAEDLVAKSERRTLLHQLNRFEEKVNAQQARDLRAAIVSASETDPWPLA